jgi:hypothetical protein
LKKVFESALLTELGIESHLSTKNFEITRIYPNIKKFTLKLNGSNPDHLDEFVKFTLAMPNLEVLILDGFILLETGYAEFLNTLHLKSLDIAAGCSQAVLESLKLPNLNSFTIKASTELMALSDSWMRFFETHGKLFDLNFIGIPPSMLVLQFMESLLPKLQKITVSKIIKGANSKPLLNLISFSKLGSKFEVKSSGGDFDLLEIDSSSVIILERKQKKNQSKKEIVGKLKRDTLRNKEKEKKQCTIS